MAAAGISSLLTGYPHRPGSMHVLRLFVPNPSQSTRLARLISTLLSNYLYKVQPSSTKRSCSAATPLAHRVAYLRRHHFPRFVPSLFLFASPQALSVRYHFRNPSNATGT